MPSPIIFVDTHCHIHLCTTYSPNPTHAPSTLPDLLRSADTHGVHTIIDIATTLEESRTLLASAIDTAGLQVTIAKVIGLHPDTATADPHEDIHALTALVKNHHADIVGMGECGIDYYRPGYNAAWQEKLFCAQIELSITYDKALVVHSRNAAHETLAILDRYRHQLSRVVMHCYSYDTEVAYTLADRGWLLGIGGSFTYPKNVAVREAVKAVGLGHIVLETDAPFLAPQVVRGTPNTPGNIPLIAQAIARELSCELADVARVTTENAKKLFGV